MIAALFVQDRGCYFGLPDVDPWPESRDARLYCGPHPVIAHPPCDRWGRFATGGPSHHGKYLVGDDAGCFASALLSVRNWGGVLEHPKDTKAWKAYGILPPPAAGGWAPAGDGAGWVCCVEQGHYGHVARKPTWLYAVGIDRLELKWGPSSGSWATDPNLTEARRIRAAKEGVCVLLSKRQRAATPPAFRDLLIQLAQTVR